MTSIIPETPSYTFGYWRPWSENANMFGSYLDYARDVSLAKYEADNVGHYINKASQEQIHAINKLGQSIGRGLNILTHQMSDINKKLGFLNRNMDIQIEQQKLSNLMLQNIAELLRVPNSEKERLHCIELGIKFFVNAKKDSDLYADSLEELLKAESLMRQDYFVLHRIGCIYLYVEKYINPEKAFEYFLRAAKYASVESGTGAIRLANILNTNFNNSNDNRNNDEGQIGYLVADSYEKAAFAAYILGRFEDAVDYQNRALKLDSTSKNRFILSKYQVRSNCTKEALDNLDKSIDQTPIYAQAVFKEIDLFNEPEVLNLIATKNTNIDNRIKQLTEKWKAVKSTKAYEIVKELSELLKKSYEIKIADYNRFCNEEKLIIEGINILHAIIDDFCVEIKKTTFLTFSADKIQTFIEELQLAKDLPLEKMQIVFNRYEKLLNGDKLQIGSKFAGGIVVYLDKSGMHGLVCADIDFGMAIWGNYVKIGADGSGIADGSGRDNTKKIVEFASWHIEKGFFSSKKTPEITAARLCLESNHNGYNDWYLPTRMELNELYVVFKNLKNRGFEHGYYWSSTEGISDGERSAWKRASDGIETYDNKKDKCHVRAVRVF